MVAKLQRVALHAPGNTLRNADVHQWHYGQSFDPQELDKDYQGKGRVYDAKKIE